MYVDEVRTLHLRTVYHMPYELLLPLKGLQTGTTQVSDRVFTCQSMTFVFSNVHCLIMANHASQSTMFTIIKMCGRNL